jgi:hypothetical protein
MVARINPKQAQNFDVPVKDPVDKEIPESPAKSVQKSEKVGSMPFIKVETCKTPDLTYDTIKGVVQTARQIENSNSLDSARKYASEHEQKLQVQPEVLSNLESLNKEQEESSYEGFNIELKPCELTSNDSCGIFESCSSNMTPRIEQQIKLETPKKVSKEIDFTKGVERVKLSAEQIAMVKHLTSSRRKEILEKAEGGQQIKPTSLTEELIIQNKNLGSSPDEIRKKRRIEIIKNLDNLL